MKFDTGRFI